MVHLDCKIGNVCLSQCIRHCNNSLFLFQLLSKLLASSCFCFNSTTASPWAFSFRSPCSPWTTFGHPSIPTNRNFVISRVNLVGLAFFPHHCFVGFWGWIWMKRQHIFLIKYRYKAWLETLKPGRSLQNHGILGDRCIWKAEKSIWSINKTSCLSNTLKVTNV